MPPEYRLSGGADGAESDGLHSGNKRAKFCNENGERGSKRNLND